MKRTNPDVVALQVERRALRLAIAVHQARLANPRHWDRKDWFAARDHLQALKLRLADLEDQLADSGDLP